LRKLDQSSTAAGAAFVDGFVVMLFAVADGFGPAGALDPSPSLLPPDKESEEDRAEDLDESERAVKGSLDEEGEAADGDFLCCVEEVSRSVRSDEAAALDLRLEELDCFVLRLVLLVMLLPHESKSSTLRADDAPPDVSSISNDHASSELEAVAAGVAEDVDEDGGGEMAKTVEEEDL